MKEKVLICNVRMNKYAQKSVYTSDDKHFPVSDTPVTYPVLALYEKILKPGDKVKAVLISKMDSNEEYKDNINNCLSEIEETAARTGAEITPVVVYSRFEENATVHGKLLMDIIDRIDEDSDITVDMTYGPKDQAIVLFYALEFAEKFLGCEIANIIYGKADFVDGKPTNTKICEMAPLYYINKMMNDVQCNDPIKAKQILKLLMNI